MDCSVSSKVYGHAIRSNGREGCRMSPVARQEAKAGSTARVHCMPQAFERRLKSCCLCASANTGHASARAAAYRSRVAAWPATRGHEKRRLQHGQCAQHDLSHPERPLLTPQKTGWRPHCCALSAVRQRRKWSRAALLRVASVLAAGGAATRSGQGVHMPLVMFATGAILRCHSPA